MEIDARKETMDDGPWTMARRLALPAQSQAAFLSRVINHREVGKHAKNPFYLFAFFLASRLNFALASQ
jgi:hypothetical protein